MEDDVSVQTVVLVFMGMQGKNAKQVSRNEFHLLVDPSEGSSSSKSLKKYQKKRKTIVVHALSFEPPRQDSKYKVSTGTRK